MSYTAYGANDAMAIKLWSKKLAVEANKSIDIDPLIGEGDGAIIQEKTETKKGNGDQVTFGLRMQLVGDGFSSSDVAEGNGEQLGTNSDKVTIDELGHVVGVKSENTIDQQRVPFNLREQARGGLADWFQTRKTKSFFAHVCGFTPVNALGTNAKKYSANNAVTAPSAGRIFRPNARANDTALVTGDFMTLDLIDKAVELAKTGGSTGKIMIRPIVVGGRKVYVMYLHSTQVTSLRTNTASGQWLDIQKAAMAGMESSKSPIFSGALGEYNGVVLREAQDVTQGVSADGKTAVPNTRRAVLLGAQAATIAYGKAGGETRYRWNEELLDHKRNLEVSAWAIWGLKKTTFNGDDFGTIVVPTYAAPVA
ncbi:MULTISPECIES: N4-gp56 family major capsid protein [unclassified Methylobacterium]|uniref:N4-gp56 family major capsid protein n=1 Tax=unclassified Methylobacterium TaxID=2615210 RepID=UPI0006FC60BD|nr:MULTISPECIES: N4-gp56 family major capsid protein [unclassified Methylobacterium]KQP50832.1 N4-gp56 family major capsid protein [Methylobacterium sp. Leaf108]KQT88928.1 N4-gp56 family major capsid protein [Methylobacterium sp. Leaf466]